MGGNEMSKTLYDIQGIVFEEYKKNGYFKMWSRGFKSDFSSQEQRIYDIAELSLIITEIVESIEDIRNIDKWDLLLDKLGVELADIIIRTLNFASRKGINMEYHILEKNKRNLERKKLHGKLV
jgi:NTP pyrophosphatase (non-canonical NTP hydrolase)